MDFHMVDMIIVGLILFLAVRGLVNGFTKELFNFFALVGGVAVAARAHTPVAEWINQQHILPDMNVDFQKFIGFAVILLVIWIVLSITSSIVSRFTSDNPSLISRLFGYLVSVARYLFIFSLIVFGISNSEFLKENLEKHYSGSQLFTPMANIGGELLNMDENQTVPQVTENSESNISSELNTTSEINATDVNDDVNLSRSIALSEYNRLKENLRNR